MTKKQANPKKTTAFDQAYQEELDKAALRIGQDTFEGLAWLIQFAQSDLDALSQGALIDLGYELNCLADFRYTTRDNEGPFGDFGISLHDWEGHTRFKGKVGATNLAQVITDERPVRPKMNSPSVDQIKHLQQSVTGLIVELLQEGTFSLELPPIALHAFTDKELDYVGLLTIAECPLDLFTHNLAFLLVKGASRIRRCPECQRIFAADRKNKMSCSVRCQNTAAVRRLRQSSPDRKGKRGRPPGTGKTALTKATPSPKRRKS